MYFKCLSMFQWFFLNLINSAWGEGVCGQKNWRVGISKNSVNVSNEWKKTHEGLILIGKQAITEASKHKVIIKHSNKLSKSK